MIDIRSPGLMETRIIPILPITIAKMLISAEAEPLSRFYCLSIRLTPCTRMQVVAMVAL